MTPLAEAMQRAACSQMARVYAERAGCTTIAAAQQAIVAGQRFDAQAGCPWMIQREIARFTWSTIPADQRDQLKPIYVAAISRPPLRERIKNA